MNFAKPVISVFAVALMALSLAGCQEKEGPAEKAGKEIDKAAASMGQAIQNAGEKIQNSAK
jgi:predicted small secreted protein